MSTIKDAKPGDIVTITGVVQGHRARGGNVSIAWGDEGKHWDINSSVPCQIVRSGEVIDLITHRTDRGKVI